MLKVEKLVKNFHVKSSRHKFVHAVDDVSFSISEGQTLGLVGETGCGKSTVARTVIRIYKPTAGKIFIDGDEVSHLTNKQLMPVRKKIQMIFQDPYASLNAHMTVKDIIAEPLIAHKIGSTQKDRDQLVFDMLAKVGLNKDHANRYAHEFSGGQRQRIGIARALMIQPKIVICDEPISALDVSIQAQVINMLKDFQNELNLTYLFIAHDLSMVRYVSDHVGVMYLGRMVELAESGEIYKNPLHPYSQGLINSVPVPNPKLARQKQDISIEGDIPSPISPPSGCHFHTRCKYCTVTCKSEQPMMKDIGNDHFVACHLYK